MNLFSCSIKNRGVHNFACRLRTVFTRFGFLEERIRRALYAVIDALHKYDSAPTFYIPAIVLNLHVALVSAFTEDGAEIGIHRYERNGYRSLQRRNEVLWRKTSY